jgi:hypothetical protein
MTILFENEQEVTPMENMRKVGSNSLAGQGVLMLCLGMALSALGSVMANPLHAELGYGLAAVLTSLCLLVAVIHLGVLEVREGSRRPVAIYLLAAGSSITCWLIFWLAQSASADIRFLGILAGLHGLFWGLWYVRLAIRFQSYAAKAVVLCFLAASTSCVGIILATWPELTKLSSVTVVACYLSFIGTQILLTAAFLHRECEAEREFAGWKQREAEMDSARMKTSQ